MVAVLQVPRDATRGIKRFVKVDESGLLRATGGFFHPGDTLKIDGPRVCVLGGHKCIAFKLVGGGYVDPADFPASSAAAVRWAHLAWKERGPEILTDAAHDIAVALGLPHELFESLEFGGMRRRA
jgi:hypothetical protein